MNMNFESLMKLHQAWNTFQSNHPKFPEFLNAVLGRQIAEGTAVDITVTYPDGKTARTHISLRESDLALLESLKGIK